MSDRSKHETPTPDPIVVVGMAVEAPGGVHSPADFWSVLAGAREVIGPLPRDRGWPIDELLALGGPGGYGQVCDAGGFLDGASEFDPMFFGITPREAAATDPQQRVAMRVAWRALEHAGMNPGGLAGASGGCYMGASVTEYGPRAAAVNDYTGHRTTGTALGAVAGRISHCLGLFGPSLTVDGACASSLAAVHLAAAAIRAGECDWALAGGVCVMGSPAAFFEFAKQGALAADGHCRSYAADTTGTLWGEGAGVVVLEAQSRARALGHRVYGRLQATRINHNGAGAPLVAPSAAAQQRLIEQTVAVAGIPSTEIGMIEGHGTATALGDRAELIALARTYGACGASTPVGSVKSNIGHSQAASGILGLVKVLLCADHGMVAPTLFADPPSEAVDWDRVRLVPATTPTAWEACDGVRYGAVSSFGVGGTNAHAIVAIDETEVCAHG